MYNTYKLHHLGSIPLTEIVLQDSNTDTTGEDDNRLVREIDLRASDTMEIRDHDNITLKKGESFFFYLHSDTDIFDYPNTDCVWQPPLHDDYAQCSIFAIDEATQWTSLGEGDGEQCGHILEIRYLLQM